MGMESFWTDDGLVGKHLHDDGSETAIKFLSSCDTVRDPVTGRVVTNHVERRKYSVFASGSAGCFMKCAFCYLTIKGAKYHRLAEGGILSNLLEAVAAERTVNRDIGSRYAKICWMGMGEDHMLHVDRTRRLTVGLMRRLMENGDALGIDGCDLATVLPPGVDIERCIDELCALNAELSGFPVNPHNAKAVHAANTYTNTDGRTLTRVFWSLPSATPDIRLKLIPRSGDVREAAARIRRLRDATGLDLIVHHFFLDGVNDTIEEVDALVAFLRDQGLDGSELRILRYNSCRNTPHSESLKFDRLVERLATGMPRLKVQISSGAEVRAACGQFIVMSTATGAQWVDRLRQDGEISQNSQSPLVGNLSNE